MRQNYLHVYAGKKFRGEGLMGKWEGEGAGGGVIAGFYGNVKGHPQDNVRVTVMQVSPRSLS